MFKSTLILVAAVLCGTAHSQGMCFKSGEQVSGMNKICYYRCVTGTVAITIGFTQLCPLSINGKASAAEPLLAKSQSAKHKPAT